MLQDFFHYCQQNPKMLIWIIPVMIAVHELEEWNILNWYKRHYKIMPPSSHASIRIHIVSFIAVSFALTSLAFWIPSNIVFSLIIVFLTVFLFTNSIQHIIWTFQYGEYATGLATSVVALAGSGFALYFQLANHMLWFPAFGLFAISAKPLYETFTSKGCMSPVLMKIHLFFSNIENRMRLFSH